MPKPSNRARSRKLDRVARESLYGQLEGRNLVKEIDDTIEKIVKLVGAQPCTRTELDWVKLRVEGYKVKLSNLQKFLDKILPNRQATEIEREITVTPQDRLVAEEMGVSPEEVAKMRADGESIMELVSTG
jgi:hypothetical protein